MIQNVFLYAIYILNSNAKLINPILPSVQTSNLGGVLYEEILGKFFTTPHDLDFAIKVSHKNQTLTPLNRPIMGSHSRSKMEK